MSFEFFVRFGATTSELKFKYLVNDFIRLCKIFFIFRKKQDLDFFIQGKICQIKQKFLRVEGYIIQYMYLYFYTDLIS